MRHEPEPREKSKNPHRVQIPSGGDRAVIDENLGDRVQVTVVATGFGAQAKTGADMFTRRPTTTSTSPAFDVPPFMKK